MSDGPYYDPWADDVGAWQYFGFADPWRDYTSTVMPRTITDVLRWAQAAWAHNGIYRQAAKRTVKFFLTSLEYSGLESKDETDNWSKFHNNDLKVLDALGMVGEDFSCYGNSFSSVYVPFLRYLRCPRCGLEKPISNWDWQMPRDKFLSRGGCPGTAKSKKEVCGYKGELERYDRKSRDTRNIRIIRWNPFNMRIAFNGITADARYVYRIPEQIKQGIRQKDRLYMEYTPWEIIQTVMQNKLFEFDAGVIFHVKEDTVAGIMNMGWGIPSILYNLRLLYRIQVLKMYDEAIALDYVVPLRVITPATNSPRADPMVHANLGSFAQRVSHMIRRRRRDPAQWGILPFPIDYKVWGGDAKELAPVELQSFALDELLNAQGFPAELFKGSLSLQAMPTAIRLFIQMQKPWVSAINGWLDWSTSIVSEATLWEKPTVRMQPNTIADDIDMRQIQMQLAMANRISLGTALAPMEIDLKRELEKRYEETKAESEMQQRYERDMQNQQAQGSLASDGSLGKAMGGPAGSNGMSGGNGMSVSGMSPRDVHQQAMELAQQLVNNPSISEKRKILGQISQTSRTLYALVKSYMQDLRQEAGAAGRDALLSR